MGEAPAMTARLHVQELKPRSQLRGHDRVDDHPKCESREASATGARNRCNELPCLRFHSVTVDRVGTATA